MALDVETREIVGCYIGDRSGESAQALRRSLLAVYRQYAVCYTDFWVSYPVALPSPRQMPAATLRERAVGKESGLTRYICRLAPRRGHKRAIVAVAHRLLIAVYHILKQHQPYRDYRTTDTGQRTQHQLIQTLQHRIRLGYQVQLTPIATAQPPS